MGTVPTPRVFKDRPDPASILTYAEWNAALYDTVYFLLNPPMVHVQQQTAQNIANSTWVAVTWDTEIVDTEGSHSTVTNPTRITPKTPGLYMGWFGSSWANNTTGKRHMAWRQNGTFVGGHSRVDWRPTISGTAQKGFRFWLPFNGTTDYLELMVWQNSGATLATFPQVIEPDRAASPELYMRWWKTL